MTGQPEPPYISLPSAGFDDPEEGDPEGEFAWYAAQELTGKALEAAIKAALLSEFPKKA